MARRLSNKQRAKILNECVDKIRECMRQYRVGTEAHKALNEAANTVAAIWTVEKTKNTLNL